MGEASMSNRQIEDVAIRLVCWSASWQMVGQPSMPDTRTMPWWTSRATT